MREAVSGLLGSPLRNLAAVIVFVLAIAVVGVTGYRLAGWSFGDAIYMVVLTLFTVGYGEVRPIDTPALHLLTMTVMIFGCTGMILLTGVLVQVFTVGQIKQLLGLGGVNSEIEKLKASGPTAKEVADTKETFLRDFESNTKQNRSKSVV